MIKEQKRMMRAEATKQRRQQVDKDLISRDIIAALVDLPEYRRAESPVLYVDVRDEVRTQPLVAEQLAAGRSAVVPFCQGDELRLCRIDSMDQLATGAYGILEPTGALQNDEARRVEIANAGPGRVDLIVLPGVAFDRRGYRLGHGFGYYDRLLAQAASDVKLVALAFDCQIFDNVPHEPHDIPVDVIVTESAVYRR